MQPTPANWVETIQNSHEFCMQFSIQSGYPNLQTLYTSPVFVNGKALNTSTGFFSGGLFNAPGNTNTPGTFSYLPAITTTGHYPNIAVTSGNVTIAKDTDQRSRFTMELIDTTGYLISDNILQPFGNEMVISTGVVINGTPQMIQLGVFRITDVTATDEGKGVVIQVQGQDRSRIVSRASVPLFYQTASNQAYTAAMMAMITSAYPYVQFDQLSWSNVPPVGIAASVGGADPNMIYTPVVYGITFQQGDDLWDEARQMAASLACDLYFSRYGVCTLTLDPNLNYMNAVLPQVGTPVASFIEGETMTAQKLTLVWSDQSGYNQWVITGEGQVLGYSQQSLQNNPFAKDTDSTSATYINGPYLQVTGFETNTYMTAQSQINLYGQYMLATSIGKQQMLTIDALANPALDVDDAVMVTRTKLGLNQQLFVVHQIVHPLMHKDSMKVTMRQQRSYTVGALTSVSP